MKRNKSKIKYLYNRIPLIDLTRDNFNLYNSFVFKAREFGTERALERHYKTTGLYNNMLYKDIFRYLYLTKIKKQKTELPERKGGNFFNVMKRGWDKSKVVLLINLWEEGKTAEEIGKRIGKTARAVYCMMTRLKNAGSNFKRRGRWYFKYN